MELEAKLIQDLGVKSGVSKAGNPWKKKEWVAETFGQYPKKVKLQCFGDRSDTMNPELGKSYSFSIDIESREWNGNWFTDISVYAMRELGDTSQGAPQNYSQPAAQAAPFGAAPRSSEPGMQADPFGAASGDSDDLPF